MKSTQDIVTLSTIEHIPEFVVISNFVMNTRAPMGHEVFKPKSLKISTHEHTIDEQVSSLHLNLIDLSKYMQEREDSCCFFLTHPVVKYGE